MLNYIQEQLQETIIELENCREREKTLFDENKTILTAISAMGKAENKHQVFNGLNQAIKQYIDFDDVVVLTRASEQKPFETLLSTNTVFTNKAWQNDAKFNRVLNGECIILYEPTKLNAFENFNTIVKEQIQSVLITGMKTPATQALIVFISAVKGHFSIDTKSTLRHLRPLFKRAVIDIENKEHLHKLVEIRTQELLAAQKETDKANQVKSEFLAMMSHEIKTPLNSVLGMLDVLKGSQLNEEQHDILSQVECSADLLLVIINDILNLSKINSGQFSLSPQWCHLHDTVTFAVMQQQHTALDKNLSLTLNCTIEPERLYWVDSNRLAQILFNIVGNAIKFTLEGMVNVDVYQNHSNELCICVLDTGIGIAKDKQSQLFTSFKQADSSITRRFGGSGLGLSITKHLVTLMGGSIELSSQLGIGSQFTIIIPLKNKLIPKVPVTIEPSSTTNNKTILVVDDTLSNQVMMKIMLSSLGFEVLSASNGKEAIEMIHNNNTIDLIFMDISMPIMDGLEATKILRQAECKTPIIALTAHTTITDKEQCLKSGMCAFIEKPIRKKNIMSITNQFLNNQENYGFVN